MSRTVIRESVKRIEDKGLITGESGRGTTVQPSASWNILHPVVLSLMLENDDSLGVLDDLAVIGGALEGAMSAETALRRTEDQLHDVRAALERMASSVRDLEHFPEADLDFHFLVMTLSGNQLASNIMRILFEHARQTVWFSSNQTAEAHELTLSEHRRVYEAIEAGDAAAAQSR